MQNSTKLHSTDKNTDKKTKLYRHFDSNGGLLYVGISLSPTYRLSQHRATAPWFDDIATITIENYPTRQAALEAEARAIHYENPAHNRMRPVPKPLPRGSWVQEMGPPTRKPERKIGRLRLVPITEGDIQRLCRNQRLAEMHQKYLWTETLTDEEYLAYEEYSSQPQEGEAW